MPGWGAAIAFIFQVIGKILDLHAQNTLTQEKKDAIIAALHQVQ
jgi:hypothetical protein